LVEEYHFNTDESFFRHCEEAWPTKQSRRNNML